ncbi:MAG: serine/threonine-protein kinase [Gammaproteobacteria bacterium]|nr:MAG: serine/threonine-protein kinase [Gammaproteobacteria bacterium]
MKITIPGYKIEHLIAEGGTASVYLAIQESLRRHVAIKLLRKFDNPEQLTRFLNEGQIIASLNHRNVINIHDIGVTDDGRPYISMEYLEGGDLDARIPKKVDPEDALQWLEALGNCLDFVHRKGIIHRDIKPGNILFHKDGTPILTDFGTAKQQKSDAKLTMDGRAFGSPYYISPEQAASKKLDRRTDIYSLGIVLYEMLTGNKPYKGDSHIETIVAHMSDPLPVLPPELHRYRTLTNKMIAKSPDDRFTNAAEMVRFVQQLRKPVKKARRMTWAPAGALATIIGIGGAVLIGQSIIPERNEHPATPGKTTSEAVIPESTPATVEMPSPEPGDPVKETPVATSTNEQHIEELLSQAAIALKEYRLTKPTNSNAYHYYQQILELHPQHEEAIKGINRIADAYADLAESKLDQYDYQAARRHLHQGLTIQPANHRLQALQKKANIGKLLSQAATALKEHRLTRPKNNNAYYYYQRILELHPKHKQALKGITRIADAYGDLAESKLDKFNYVAAKQYLHRGLKIQPDNARLQELQKNTNAFRDAPGRLWKKIKSPFS